jgi:hypothetical protein
MLGGGSSFAFALLARWTGVATVVGATGAWFVGAPFRVAKVQQRFRIPSRYSAGWRENAKSLGWVRMPGFSEYAPAKNDAGRATLGNWTGINWRSLDGTRLRAF